MLPVVIVDCIVDHYYLIVHSRIVWFDRNVSRMAWFDRDVDCVVVASDWLYYGPCLSVFSI